MLKIVVIKKYMLKRYEKIIRKKIKKNKKYKGLKQYVKHY